MYIGAAVYQWREDFLVLTSREQSRSLLYVRNLNSLHLGSMARCSGTQKLPKGRYMRNVSNYNAKYRLHRILCFNYGSLHAENKTYW